MNQIDDRLPLQGFVKLDPFSWGGKAAVANAVAAIQEKNHFRLWYLATRKATHFACD